MLRFGLNHMTAPRLSTRELFDLAKSLGCDGVELRNDLPGQPFDGGAPLVAKAAAAATQLSIFGLAEIKSFNNKIEQRLGDGRGDA